MRLLLAANGLMLVFALIGNRSLPRLPGEIAELAALVEPALLLLLALMFWLAPWLQRLSPWRGMLVVVALAVAVAAGMDLLLARLLGSPPGWRTRPRRRPSAADRTGRPRPARATPWPGTSTR